MMMSADEQTVIKVYPTAQVWGYGYRKVRIESDTLVLSDFQPYIDLAWTQAAARVNGLRTVISSCFPGQKAMLV